MKVDTKRSNLCACGVQSIWSESAVVHIKLRPIRVSTNDRVNFLFIMSHGYTFYNGCSLTRPPKNE